MSNNILESYLVKLGVTIDQPGFQQFQMALGKADTAVTKYATGFAASALKFQIAATGAFAAVAAAAVGFADHIANADQEYRLFALHMYMSQDAARGLKITMDALGASLEDIAWDRELNNRANLLFLDQRIMGMEIGPNFERNMRQLRDIRFEFVRLQVEAKYLSMGVVSSVFEKMGLGSGELLKRLEQLNNWVITNLPQIIEFFSSRLAPVLYDIKNVLGDSWKAAEQFGVVFTNLVGLLSGDHSLEGTEFSFRKLADAVGMVSHALAISVQYMMLAEQAMMHMVNAAVLAASGKMSEASKELKAGLANYNATTGAMILAPVGGLIGLAAGGPVGAIAGFAAGGITGVATGDLKQHFSPSEGSSNLDMAGIRDSQTRWSIDQAIRSSASKYGVDEKLLRSIIGVESSFNPNAVGPRTRTGEHAQGLMQLMPGIQQAYGVRNPFDPSQNVEGGAHLLADLLKRYKGDVRSAVAAYNEGSGNFDKGRMPMETAEYLKQVLGGYMATSSPSSGQVQNTTIGDMHFHVNGTNATPEQIAKAVTDKIKGVQDKANQRGTAQQGSSYAYAY